MAVKERVGTVVSDKMQKTIAVLVETRVQHPRYKKFVVHRKKFYAHDEKEEAGVGDVVRIREILQRAPSGLAGDGGTGQP